MTNQAVRVAALVVAGVIVVACLAFVAVLGVSGHLDSSSNPYVITVMALMATSIPSLIAIAAVQSTRDTVDKIHGLVNGNYTQALKALADIAKSNPTRRASDAATVAGTAMLNAPEVVVPPVESKRKRDEVAPHGD